MLAADEPRVPLDPLLGLLHLRHTYASPHSTPEEKEQAKKAVLEEIKQHNMRPFYIFMSDIYGWPVDSAAVAEMDRVNEAVVREIGAKVLDAEEKLGDTEVRDALQKKCDHLARIGDFEGCLRCNKECFSKTLAAGPKLDLCFQQIRLGIAFSDNNVAAEGIQSATRLMKDGDWERRNRLKVYEGLYHVYVRNFEKGSRLLIESLATFTSTELLDFEDFVFITAATALPTLSRPELKASIIESSEVTASNAAAINALISSIYLCRYRSVFPLLEAACVRMRHLVFLSAHVHYFFREVRILVLNQFLDSYSSVTLVSMAAAFQLPQPILDQMLCGFISNERIACKIDRVNGSVQTYRGDATNFQYHKVLKTGDALLSRIQKLSRHIDI